MRIRRIEVPAFRVLRNVDLTFEAEFTPQIFPIGSENGGGKSTLLQLIFALLHCSSNPEQRMYLMHLMSSFDHPPNVSEQLLARLTVEQSEGTVTLEFVSLGLPFLIDALGKSAPASGFAAGRQATENRELIRFRRERDVLTAFGRELESVERSGSASAVLKELAERHPDLVFEAERVLHFPMRFVPDRRRRGMPDLKTVLETTLLRLERDIDAEAGRVQQYKQESEQIQHLLKAKNYFHIADYQPTKTDPSEPDRCLICRTTEESADGVCSALVEVSKEIFLLGPSNQQYLFLPLAVRRAMVSAAGPEYMSQLAKAEKALPGFFAYDWLSVEPLVKLFSSARDQDFRQVIRTGNYGDGYTVMLREVNQLLTGKKVQPLEDLTGVEFLTSDGQGGEVTLSPEDLSRGELKRLMIYAWLKTNDATNAVVLIDEIETSFHPDWQLGIVRDLDAWGPNNQYLLATHSYELCRAVTPAHVRTLEPRMRQFSGAHDDDVV